MTEFHFFQRCWQCCILLRLSNDSGRSSLGNLLLFVKNYSWAGILIVFLDLILHVHLDPSTIPSDLLHIFNQFTYIVFMTNIGNVAYHTGGVQRIEAWPRISWILDIFCFSKTDMSTWHDRSQSTSTGLGKWSLPAKYLIRPPAFNVLTFLILRVWYNNFKLHGW